jgi:hypothetical protein
MNNIIKEKVLDKCKKLYSTFLNLIYFVPKNFYTKVANSKVIIKIKKITGFDGNSSSYLFHDIKNFFKTKARSIQIIFSIFKTASEFCKALYTRIVYDISRIASGKERIAVNHYKLGKMMLKEGSLVDAKIRFLLADTFYKKSPMIKYYIAYVYYMEGNTKKSLIYLRSAIDLKPNMTQARNLFDLIDKQRKW